MSEADFASRVGTRAHSNHPRDAAAPTVSTNDWAQIASAARCWAQAGDAFFPVTDVVKEIPPGAYRCRMSNQGPFLEKMKIDIDSLLHLPDGAVESLLAEFRQFWTLQQNFAERGFTFKRGMLMWGPPGSGKTSAIWQMTQEIVASHRGVVVFVEDPNVATMCITVLRRIEPERPMISIMEDLDALVNRHGEHGFLALLDGETQISNVVHLATTNYPEFLDKRFVDRPSRFDTIMHVGMPSTAARKMYFEVKEPALAADELARWVKRSEGYSIAHLREIIIAIKCFEQDEDKVFTRLDAMRQERLASDGMGGERGQAGFGLGGRVGRP